MNKFPYTTILITGASSGIGEAIARALAKPGFRLILVARSADALETHAREFRSSGATVDVIAMDLTSENAPQRLFDQINKLNIRVDLLVNNAGFGSYGYFHESDIAKQMNMIDLNIKTLVQLTHLFLPGMLSQNKGAILNVSSTASFQ
ncbi:MAG TPA: SDR family NAD(P)-dependent oxidoreductase, partial [bacterium]|nr:SDR family NAD(P)-dependent oxidoreductase [bacterium]